MQLPWLSSHSMQFPPVESALSEPDGLLAAGGDLSPARLLSAYQQGIFPWYEDPQPILWWSPNPRAVIQPDKLHISRSLRKTLRNTTITVRFDTAFTEVIAGCAELSQNRDGTWIGSDMLAAYIELHKQGWAHSVEAWQNDELVGGLYGIAIGRVFFGESMFSRVSNASKIAMVHLAGQLTNWNFKLIDCQVSSPHILSLGAEMMPRELFSAILANHALPSTDIVSNATRWQLDWRYNDHHGQR